jgi:hypothetical protein
MEEFKIRLSYESWDSIFRNNDKMVDKFGTVCITAVSKKQDSLLNIFLNNYLRIVYPSKNNRER